MTLFFPIEEIGSPLGDLGVKEVKPHSHTESAYPESNEHAG